jgi:hypothetical protein
MYGVNRRDGEAIAALQDGEIGQRWRFAQGGERNQRELAHELHIDMLPAGGFWLRFGIEVFALRIKLRGIGVGQAADFHDASDTGPGAGGMVEEREIAQAHLAHEIAGLVVAHTRPRHGLIRQAGEIVDGAFIGLAFHEPEALGGDGGCHAATLSLLFSETNRLRDHHIRHAPHQKKRVASSCRPRCCAALA